MVNHVLPEYIIQNQIWRKETKCHAQQIDVNEEARELLWHRG